MSKVQPAVFPFFLQIFSSPPPPSPPPSRNCWISRSRVGLSSITASSPEAHVHWGSRTAFRALHLRHGLSVQRRTEKQRELRQRPARSRLPTGKSQQSLLRMAPAFRAPFSLLLSSTTSPPPALTFSRTSRRPRPAPAESPPACPPRLPPSPSGSCRAPAGRGSGRARTA